MSFNVVTPKATTNVAAYWEARTRNAIGKYEPGTWNAIGNHEPGMPRWLIT